MEQKTRTQDTKYAQDTKETKDTKDTKDAKDTKDTQDTKDIKDTEDHTKDHTNIVSREESTDLGVQNSWCIELLVRTTIPPTFSKNNKGAPSARPTGARSAPVLVSFAKCCFSVHEFVRSACKDGHVVSMLHNDTDFCKIPI